VSLVTKSDIEKVLSDIVNNFLEKKLMLTKLLSNSLQELIL